MQTCIKARAPTSQGQGCASRGGAVLFKDHCMQQRNLALLAPQQQKSTI